MNQVFAPSQRFARLRVLLLSLFFALSMQPAGADPLRVFIIGNSFSGNAALYLPKLAKEGGHDLVLGRAEAPGHSLSQHWKGVQAAEADPTNPKGKLYGGKTLRDLLGKGTWDIVTMQQASIQSADRSTYEPAAMELAKFVHTLQPQAEIVLHQTWAYRSDSKDFGPGWMGKKTVTDQEMWERSRAAYLETAKELKVRVIPNGDAFWAIASDPVWGYKKDTAFDFANPVYPALPDQTHSLHRGYSWKEQKAILFDSHHANDAGCYLGGLVWYATLFHDDPQKLAFLPPKVDAEFAAQLRKVAAETVKNSPLAAKAAE